MNSFNKYCLGILALLIFFQQDISAAPVTPEENDECFEEKNLKVLSWNIYMLPKIVVRKGKRERAYAIVEELKKSDFDIIVFQEAFLPAARKIIGEGLASLFKFQYGPANGETPNIKTNSGVWVISKVKLEQLGTIKFDDCGGLDCWARKGAMLLQGVWHGKAFQILGTHLQADLYPVVRQKQMMQIYTDLISKFKVESVPQIICGDMNTENEMKDYYCDMLSCFDAEDGDIDGVEKETYDGVNNEIAKSYGAKKKFSLDYILVRSNGIKMKSIKRFVSIMKKGKKQLSDHYGLICELKF